MLQKRLYSRSPSAYQLFDRTRRRTRPLYETDRQKHLRERHQADYLLLSLPNCGRTWLRVILGKAMQLQYAAVGRLQAINLYDLYSFSERLPLLPAVKPIHEKFGQWGHTYAGQKVILLVRDPRDAIVSRYHQHKDELGYKCRYGSLDSYVCQSHDLADYIRFYNDWQNYRDRPRILQPDALLRIRYEDMKTDTFQAIKRVVEFLGLSISDFNLHSAITYASFQNMHRMEVTGESQIHTRVMSARNLSDPNSFKVRKGEIGEYVRELSPASVALIDKVVETELDPDYGYGVAASSNQPTEQSKTVKSGTLHYASFAPAITAIPSKQLNISVIAPDLAGGGTTRVYLVANALQKLGHKVTVVGAQFAENLYPVPPKNLTVQPIRAERSLQYLKALKQMLPKLDGDILYTIKPRPTSLGTALLRNLTNRRPLIVDIDDWEMSWMSSYRPTPKQLARDILKPQGALRNPEHPAYMEWMEKLLVRADAITATTQFLQNKFGGHYLPNGKDTALFDPDLYDSETSRIKYGLANYRVLMFPGTARPHKGLEDALMALDQLNEPDFRLVIVGGRKPDDYEDKLFEQWGHWLIKLPRFSIDAMAEVVSAAHIVVVPQRNYDTAKAQFPLKLTDGMAMAKPIISTRVGDIPSILADSGYLVDPEAPDQIAAQIKRIFAHPEEARQKGRAARLRCVANYSTERMSTVLAQVLNSLLTPVTSLT